MNHLFNLLKSGKTQFHVVKECIDYLSKEGFKMLFLGEDWDIKPNGKYMVSPYSSMLVSFVIGENPKNLRLAAAHTDFPMLKLKPNNEIIKKGYLQANIETYGGLIKETWFDRPLGLAGKVVTKGTDVFSPQVHLYDSQKPLFIIPNLAPHLKQGKSSDMDIQKEMIPVLGTLGSGLSETTDNLISHVAKSLSIKKEDILDYDLYLYISDETQLIGLNDEFIVSPRIDNISSVSAITKALVDSNINSCIAVGALFDNEEIGSRSKQGADSVILKNILDKLSKYIELPSDGFSMSVDVAHGTHPNYIEKSDPTNDIILGNGIVLKTSSTQRYVTDSEAGAVFMGLCNENNIQFQRSVNRSGITGGQTLGPIMSSYLPIKGVDIGIPVLAMHSALETAHKKDYDELEKLLTAYFSN